MATSRTFQCAVFKRGSNEAIPVVWDGSDFKLARITAYNSNTSKHQLKWPFYTTITNEYSEDEAHVNVFRYYGTGSLGSLTGANTYSGDGVFAMLNGPAAYNYLGLSGNNYTRIYYLAAPTSHGYTYPRWIGSQTVSYIEDCRYVIANKSSGGSIGIDYAVLIKTNASFNTSHMAPALRVGVKIKNGSYSSSTLQALTISNAFKKLFTYNNWDYYAALASTTGWTYDSTSQEFAASCPVLWYEASSSSQTVHYLSSMIIIH